MKRNSPYYTAMKRMRDLGEQDFNQGKPITAFPSGQQFPDRARANYEIGWRNAKEMQRVAITLAPAQSRAESFSSLLEAAQSACDWLCECAPGTDQRERGEALKKALAHYATSCLI